MKKYLSILLLPFILSFLVLFPSKSIADGQKTYQIDYINMIKERGFLKVGIPPYVTKPFYSPNEKTGEFEGYDIRLINGFAEKLGVDVKFDASSKNFNDTVYRAGKGDFDMAIGKLSTTYYRMKNAHPHEYMNFRHALLVDRKYIATIPNLSSSKFAEYLKKSDFKVGFIANSSYESFANQNLPNSRRYGYKNWGEVKTALFNGDIDAIYRDATEIKKIIYQDPNLSIKYVPILINDIQDVKSIFLPTLANNALTDILDFYLKDLEIKDDSQIMDELTSYYTSTKDS